MKAYGRRQADRSPEERLERAHLFFMRRSLEAGCCKILKAWIIECHSTLSDSNYPVIRKKYSRLRKKAEEAFAIEELHGVGSLLKLDHPMVENLIKSWRGNPAAISSEEVEAANRYSRFTSSGHFQISEPQELPLHY